MRFRIKRELSENNTEKQDIFSSSYKAKGKFYQNQTSYENSLANSAYLPELINKKNDSMVENSNSFVNQNESIRNIQNQSNKIEATSVFNTNNVLAFNKSDSIGLNSEAHQKAFNNASISETNKIKEMINQWDNK